MFQPALPHSIEELGVAPRVIYDLFLRRVYVDGTSTLQSTAESLKLSPVIIDRIYRYFAHEKLLEVRSATENDCVFALTTAGQRLAEGRMQVTQYIGPAPVSLVDYCASVVAQSAKPPVTRDALRTALADLVISDELVADLGPALTSQAPVFLYGPSGNGKTAIAERLHSIFADNVVIPYSIEVDGHIISLHDPIVHRRTAEPPDTADPRWVTCERPFVIVGGELTSDQLEVRLDDASKFYAAPMQMKANLGMLVIDDFGRQVMQPRELLNRWILPIDRRIEFLTLRHGVKFQIPFEISLVFSTNLDPNHLAEAAFLRRLPNKIYIGDVTTEVFDDIFARAAANNGLVYDFDAAEYIRRVSARAGCTQLRACLPGDICRTTAAIVQFENGSMRPIQTADLDRAVKLYFADTAVFEDTDPKAATA